VIDEQVNVLKAIRAAGLARPEGAAGTLDIISSMVKQGHSSTNGAMLSRTLTAACSGGYARRVRVGVRDLWRLTPQGENYLAMLVAFA
jgi:hypothetical protein